MKDNLKAIAGRKGGMKRGKKGFAVMSKEKVQEISAKANEARWSDEEIEMNVLLTLKFRESRIAEMVKIARSLHDDAIRKGTELEDALMALVCFNPLLGDLMLNRSASVQDRKTGEYYTAGMEYSDEERTKELAEIKDLRRRNFPLARAIAVHVIAQEFGMTPASAGKRYVSTDPDQLGELWYLAAVNAKKLSDAGRADRFNRMSKAPEGSIQ